MPESRSQSRYGVIRVPHHNMMNNVSACSCFVQDQVQLRGPGFQRTFAKRSSTRRLKGQGRTEATAMPFASSKRGRRSGGLSPRPPVAGSGFALVQFSSRGAITLADLNQVERRKPRGSRAGGKRKLRLAGRQRWFHRLWYLTCLSDGPSGSP